MELRKFIFLFCDIMIVGASPFLAISLRNDFVINWPRLIPVIPYACLCMAIAAAIFIILGTHKSIWKYVSLPDFWQILNAVTMTVILTVGLSIGLEQYALNGYSIPVIQWGVIIFLMISMRVLVRRMLRASSNLEEQDIRAEKENVLVLGLTNLTELYLRWVTEVADRNVNVVGILDERNILKGRHIHSYPILGAPGQLAQLIAKYAIHGININRVVVTTPFAKLSSDTQNLLCSYEDNGELKVEKLSDKRGVAFSNDIEDSQPLTIESDTESTKAFSNLQVFSQQKNYAFYKRAFDIIVSFSMIFILSPLIFLVGLLVIIDQGYPVTFWQQRPGKGGRPFKLYKFKTMTDGYDQNGNRIPDDERMSIIGRLLRRTRLDELPQLFNILLGEMSFIGPRPLLIIDQPRETRLRLLVRPGLTGWAQVNGGKTVSKEDKAILDLWYLQHASLQLDIKIMFMTLGMVIFGESHNKKAIDSAYKDLGLSIPRNHNLEMKPSTEKNIITPTSRQKVA